MRYFPVNLDIRGRTVVIVGGGAVAERKCFTLLAARGSVTVVAPALSEGLQRLREEGKISHLARAYQSGDLSGAFLAVAATDSRRTNRRVAEEASGRGILVNAVDDPEASGFTFPAMVARGDLLIAVSTGGKSPALARRIREELEARYGEEYAAAVHLLGKVREKLLTSRKESQYNGKLLNDLADSNLPELLRNNATEEIDRLLLRLLGPGFTLEELEGAKRDST